MYALSMSVSGGRPWAEFKSEIHGGRPWTDFSVKLSGGGPGSTFAPEVDYENNEVYIGYPFESKMVSLPVIAAEPERKKRIEAVVFRFRKSYLPQVQAIPNTTVEDITGLEEPYSGIHRMPFPGGHDRDVLFTLTMDKPYQCEILSINTEVV